MICNVGRSGDKLVVSHKCDDALTTTAFTTIDRFGGVMYSEAMFYKPSGPILCTVSYCPYCGVNLSVEAKEHEQE